MPIVDGAATVNNTMLAMLLEGKDTSTRPATPMAEDNAPLEEINRQYQIDEDLRKYHPPSARVGNHCVGRRCLCADLPRCDVARQP